MPSLRPTIAEIDLQAIRNNLNQVRRLIGPQREVLAVVKADAYGHGIVQISRELIKEGVRFLGVATAEEGIELRDAGVDASITVLGGVFPEQFGLFFDYHLTPTLYDPAWAEELSRMSEARSQKISVQIKVDTGMGRLGLRAEEALEAILVMDRLHGIMIEGVLSHFSDADLEDKEFTRAQLHQFLELQEQLLAQGN